MIRVLSAWKVAVLVAVGASCLAVSTAEAGLFRKNREIIVVPSSTTYVVSDPLVVSTSYVAPAETVVVPTRRVYTVPAETYVVPTRRVYTVPTETYVVPTRRVYSVPSVTVPALQPTRYVVPSSVIYYP